MAVAEAGALNPSSATDELYENGLHHLFEATQITFLKNIYGGLLFGFAGLFSLIVAAGCPGLEESNPGLARLLQGIAFPSGLVIIYFIDAELYTGYPMWLMITGLQRKGKPTQYALCLVISWIGNLLGAVFSSAVFSYATKGPRTRTNPVSSVNSQTISLSQTGISSSSKLSAAGSSSLWPCSLVRRTMMAFQKRWDSIFPSSCPLPPNSRIQWSICTSVQSVSCLGLRCPLEVSCGNVCCR